MKKEQFNNLMQIILFLISLSMKINGTGGMIFLRKINIVIQSLVQECMIFDINANCKHVCWF